MLSNRYSNYDGTQSLSNNELLLSMTNPGPSSSSVGETEEIKKEIKEEVQSDDDNDVPLRIDEESTETEYYRIKEEEEYEIPDYSAHKFGAHAEEFSNQHYQPRTEAPKFVYMKRPNGSMKPVHGPIAIRFNNAPEKLEVLNPQLATALKSLPGLRNVTLAEDPSSSIQTGLANDQYGYDYDNYGQATATNVVGTVRSQRVEVDGQIRDVPEEIPCKCGFYMRICLRKSRYKDEQRTYAAYRCLKKGCQTFRAVSKILNQMPELPSNRKNKRKPATGNVVHKVPRLQQATPVFKVAHPQGTATARYPVKEVVLPYREITPHTDEKEEIEPFAV